MVKRLFPSLSSCEVPINDNRDVEPFYSLYHEWGVCNTRPKEFKTCFGDNVEENSNNVDTKEINLNNT